MDPVQPPGFTSGFGATDTADTSFFPQWDNNRYPIKNRGIKNKKHFSQVVYIRRF